MTDGIEGMDLNLPVPFTTPRLRGVALPSYQEFVDSTATYGTAHTPPLPTSELMPNRLPPLTDADLAGIHTANRHRPNPADDMIMRATYALAESRVEAVVREAQREVVDAVRTAFRTCPDGGDVVEDMLCAVDQFIHPIAPTPPTCEICKGPMSDARYGTHETAKTCIAVIAARVAALEGK